MALQIGQWRVDFRPWGWIRLKEEGSGPAVYVQYEQSGPAGQERFDMRAVVMVASDTEPLSGRIWRRVPLNELEKYFLIRQVRDILGKRSEVEPPSLDTLPEYFAATKDESHFAAYEESGLLLSDGTAEGYPPGKFPQVKAPEGRLTDDFLRDVAEAYRWLTDAKRPPAPAIASMAGVPVRTVHRWIYEARKREILPPARTGRAG
ncbi:hypothetical protein [Streptomyces sp. NPDC054829]